MEFHGGWVCVKVREKIKQGLSRRPQQVFISTLGQQKCNGITKGKQMSYFQVTPTNRNDSIALFIKGRVCKMKYYTKTIRRVLLHLRHREMILYLSEHYYHLLYDHTEGSDSVFFTEPKTDMQNRTSKAPVSMVRHPFSGGYGIGHRKRFEDRLSVVGTWTVYPLDSSPRKSKGRERRLRHT